MIRLTRVGRLGLALDHYHNQRGALLWQEELGLPANPRSPISRRQRPLSPRALHDSKRSPRRLSTFAARSYRPSLRRTSPPPPRNGKLEEHPQAPRAWSYDWGSGAPTRPLLGAAKRVSF